MNLGPLEIGLIILAVLLLFGYKKLPDASRSLGRSLRPALRSQSHLFAATCPPPSRRRRPRRRRARPRPAPRSYGHVRSRPAPPTAAADRPPGAVRP